DFATPDPPTAPVPGVAALSRIPDLATEVPERSIRLHVLNLTVPRAGFKGLLFLFRRFFNSLLSRRPSSLYAGRHGLHRQPTETLCIEGPGPVGAGGQSGAFEVVDLADLERGAGAEAAGRLRSGPGAGGDAGLPGGRLARDRAERPACHAVRGRGDDP